MSHITPREKEVINLIIEGKTNSEIAGILFISIHTVKSIVENIFLKTGFHNRMQVAMWFLKNKKEND